MTFLQNDSLHNDILQNDIFTNVQSNIFIGCCTQKLYQRKYHFKLFQTKMGSFQKQPGDHAEELGVVDAAVAVHVGLLKGHSKVVTFSGGSYLLFPTTPSSLFNILI
jgi:hypothetical protein